MIRLVLSVAVGAVFLFNTASIGAMISHYKEDKEFIYSLDIKHLDAAREIDWATSNPSINNSPWIRDAPQSGFLYSSAGSDPAGHDQFLGCPAL